MWIALLALGLAHVAPSPSPEAEALGRRLAETGTLAAVLPMMVAKDRDALVAEHADWSDADKAALRATADAVAKAAIDRLMAATGHAYAERLSVEDLRALVAFNESDAARHWRAATPAAVTEALSRVGDINFQHEAAKVFCAKTGKGCPAR
ncbi:MAG: DUF2059 domain-containing protein [Sphingomonas sp.]